MPELVLNILAGIGLACLVGSFSIVVLAWLGLIPEDVASPWQGDEEEEWP